MEADVSVLEEELETLAAASRTLTACTVLPLIVLIIAIVTAFLPLVSHLVRGNPQVIFSSSQLQDYILRSNNLER